ncbi:hypothetical protein [Erwinia aphidicola]|uniref:hypothetical protein n=1 Tax=Erwinia aphidicola TaxID=68334 RepID=UPI003D1F0F2A
MEDLDYWEECISLATDECDLTLTPEQLTCLAEAVSNGHDCYSMAYYSPPDSDRYHAIEREWESKYKALLAQFETYQGNAETAVKNALRQHGDASVSIGEYGEVLRHGGRTDRIQ